ncbi:MAG: DUF5671 domain-containing protein [Pseudomonadota bacterium]|nr:DUF5671 domain-containing protein [Pseudomonadota bacterium]
MASGNQELDLFVREALARNVSKDDVEQALAAAGWPAAQARGALNAYADVPFPVPVPRPRPYLSAREAFLYLVLFATLYMAAWNLGSLLFDMIDGAWPDPASASYARDMSLRSMRWATASVIIAFPVFLYVARYLGRELERNPVKRLSAVRRWLTYLTLFLAATVLIGDMITLVYNLLGGEIAVRFLLKVLVAGVIAGAIFGYYLWDIRRDEVEQ